MKESLRKFSFVIIGVIALVIVFVIFWFIFLSGKVSTDDAQVDAHLVSLSARIPGTVVRVVPNDNQAVGTGDILVYLDPRDYDAKVAQAKAALQQAEREYQASMLNVPISNASATGSVDSAQAALKVSEANARAAQDQLRVLAAAVRKAKAELDSAVARYALASADYRRTTILAGNYVASQQQFDQAKSTFDDAKAAVYAARDTLRQAQISYTQGENNLSAAMAQIQVSRANVVSSSSGPKQVKARRQQAAAALAAIQQARANLNYAELQLSYTTIKAPVAGFVTNKTVMPGEVVAAGQPLMIITPRQMWVTANYKETQLTHVKLGDKVDIAVDTYPGLKYNGTVQSISAASGSVTSLFPPENATGNFVKVVQRIPVKIELDPAQNLGLLRVGMSVETTILVK